MVKIAKLLRILHGAAWTLILDHDANVGEGFAFPCRVRQIPTEQLATQSDVPTPYVETGKSTRTIWAYSKRDGVPLGIRPR